MTFAVSALRRVLLVTTILSGTTTAAFSGTITNFTVGDLVIDTVTGSTLDCSFADDTAGVFTWALVARQLHRSALLLCRKRRMALIRQSPANTALPQKVSSHNR